jgi:hypothetical protein
MNFKRVKEFIKNLGVNTQTDGENENENERVNEW